MEHLWAPWRMEYIVAEKIRGCLFCQKLKENQDTKNYILYRGSVTFVIMNYYPYNNGHLMVVPNRHVASLTALTETEQYQLMDELSRCERILSEVMKPNGFNIGINVGKVAGAGVEHHIHFHIVPRWNGDTNFMPVTGHTRVINEGLNETYAVLKEKFSQ